MRVDHCQRLLKNDVQDCLSQGGITPAAMENVLAYFAEIFPAPKTVKKGTGKYPVRKSISHDTAYRLGD